MKSLNICFLIDIYRVNHKFIGGGQVHLQYLIKHLKKNHSINYQIFHGQNPNILARLIISFLIIPQVIKAHHQQPFHLIHAHSIPMMLPAKIISLILRVPVVVTIHGNNMLDLYPQRKLWQLSQQPLWKYYLENLILTKIAYQAQITVSSSFKNHSNINKNIFVIHNGVDLSKFKPSTHSNSKFPTLIFVGRQDEPLKGLSVLKTAITQVKKQFPRLKLKIISSLPHSQLPQALSQANLLVLPSLSEGQPLTLLEAWAAKLPVVVTKVGENPRMVKDGVNGYLAKPGDPKDLAKKITTALQNPQLEKLGITGYHQVKTTTWKKCAQENFKVYLQVI